MAFLKFSRDKRGYEQFSLVQPANRGKARPRLLYWFRTPPNIRVGRSPFDPEIRRALEVQNPDVVFDWAAIVRTPIPPPADNERWRERRRAERAARSAAELDEGESTSEAVEPQVESVATTEGEKGPYPFSEEPVESVATDEAAATSNMTPIPSTTSSAGPPAESPGVARRRRRRRRRGRRKSQLVQGSGFKVQGSEAPDSAEENPEPGTLNPEPEGEV